MPFHDSKEILHYFTQGTYFYMIELYLCFLVYWWWTLISIKPFNLPGILEWMKFSISLSDRYESVWATQSECRGTFSMYFCRLRDGFCCQTFFAFFNIWRHVDSALRTQVGSACGMKMMISKGVWGVWQQNPARNPQKYIVKVARHAECGLCSPKNQMNNWFNIWIIFCSKCLLYLW